MSDTVRTSEKDWLEKALKLYTDKMTFAFKDDAGLGLSNKDLKSAVSLIRAAKSKGKYSKRNIIAALAGIGITGAGVWIVILAIADPEPTTKLGLLIAGGLILAITGAFGTLAALGVSFKVTAKSAKGDEFVIEPENTNKPS